MFTVKEVAHHLQVSTQAIYKQKQELIDKGYMIKNNTNQWEITDTGFNYLQDKKINFMQQHNMGNVQPVVNQVEKEEIKEDVNKKENIDISSNDTVVNLLIEQYKNQLQTVTNQLQEMTEQRNYFKAKFEEKDNLCNQYMNSHLLPPIEDELEKNSRENQKQGFFWKLFGKQ